MKSRNEIHYESYCKRVKIEARTMADMAKKAILPAVMKYIRATAETAAAVEHFGADISVETELIGQLSDRTKQLNDAINRLRRLSRTAVRCVSAAILNYRSTYATR